MSRYQPTSNPFEDDEDEGDFVMVNKKSSQSSTNSQSTSSSNQRYQNPSNRSTNPYSSGYGSSSAYSYHDEGSPFDDRRQQKMMMIDNSENNQIESTQRALASIYDSEAMGVATAEELVRQGETLDNIERKNEGMQQDLTAAQKHLNNIKSVFGGIKNWWNKDKTTPQTKRPEGDNSNSRLRTTIEKSDAVARPDVTGFFDEDDLDSRFMAGSRKPGAVAGGYKMISPVTRSAREEEIDNNLLLMSDGMSRLKGLASGLGDEIERQNDQLDRINVKVDTTGDMIENKNTQMRKILKK